MANFYVQVFKKIKMTFLIFGVCRDASDNSIESVDSDAFRDIQQLTHL